MALSRWWAKWDGLPLLPPISNFRVEASNEIALLARLAELEPTEIKRRLMEGHLPYIAYLENTPVAYGWVARQKADIGELRMGFNLPSDNRYLWDFQTLTRWRGRSIYPHLLQAILTAERQHGGEYFWIISAPENVASTVGIARAGFIPVGEILFLTQDEAALLPISNISNERAVAGATLLGLKLFEIATAPVAQCWHCVITSPLGCQCQLNRENDLESCGTLCSCVNA